MAHIPKKSGGRWYTNPFKAIVQKGSDTLDIHPDSIDWLLTDTTVAEVDSVGVVTARDGGYTMLVAKWKHAVGAAAIIIEDLDVTWRSGYITQGVGGVSNYIAGKPVFVQQIITADTANDWQPAATVSNGPWWRDTLYTIPMEAPDSGLPTGLKWNDYELVDSTFRAIFPSDSVKPGNLHVAVDWNTRDSWGGSGYGATVLEPPKFHLVIVPVIWDSVPDYRIMEWTKGLTADSFRIHEVQNMLPVRFGYEVTVASDSFITKQNLTTYSGWYGFLNEIDSIRQTDTTRAYYSQNKRDSSPAPVKKYRKGLS